MLAMHQEGYRGVDFLELLSYVLPMVSNSDLLMFGRCFKRELLRIT